MSSSASSLAQGSAGPWASCAVGAVPTCLVMCLLVLRLARCVCVEQVTIYLTQEQCRHARDALAKAVYAAMFEWIVSRTNECIEAKQAEVMSEDRIFIGLLDIFGGLVFPVHASWGWGWAWAGRLCERRGSPSVARSFRSVRHLSCPRPMPCFGDQPALSGTL